MSSLTRVQKRHVFDYCFGLTAKDKTHQVESLLCSNTEAANIASCVMAAMGKLQRLKGDACPNHLVERTISKLKHHSSACS